MDLYVVRHGQTDENAHGIIQGWLDTELNDVGKSQAEEAARNFGHSIDAIISSDLKRCHQTAEYFREKYPDVPYSEDARLRERGFGDAEGTHRDGHDWEVFWASNDTVSIPNAETLDAYNGRVQDFLDDTRRTLARAVLVVTHGGTINRLLDLTSEDHTYQPVKNSSVTHITLA